MTSKVYANCIPTCIVWDGIDPPSKPEESSELEEGDDPEDEVWENMENASDDEESEDEAPTPKKRRNAKS